METILTDGLISNPDLIPSCIAFDTWIANDDRNMGNIVAEPERAGTMALAKLYAIDFEKAKILRGENMLVVGMIEPRSFWPKEMLGQLCRGHLVPEEFCTRVAGITEARIDGVFESLAWDLVALDLSWRESAVFQLTKRAKEIHERVREVWHNG